LKRKLGVLKGQSGQFSEREKYLTPTGIRTPDLPDHNQVSVLIFGKIIVKKKYV